MHFLFLKKSKMIQNKIILNQWKKHKEKSLPVHNGKYFVAFILFIKAAQQYLFYDEPCQGLARFQQLQKQAWANKPFQGLTLLTQTTHLSLKALVLSLYFIPDLST